MPSAWVVELLIGTSWEKLMALSDTKTGAFYLTGLRNAHSLESEALQIMGRQVERLTNYADMEARLRQHIDETKGQQERLAAILDSHGTDSSTIKDTFQALMGNLAAMGHTMAGDEILKNSFANYAFESFEIAAYKSLIAMAEAVGDDRAISALRQNLEEEVAMQQWLESHIVPTTQRFLSLEEMGESGKV